MNRLVLAALACLLAAGAFAQDQRAHTAVPNFNRPELGVVRGYRADIRGQGQTFTCSGYTLLPSDSGKFIPCGDAGSATVTLPATLPIGFQVAIEQDGAGQVTVSAASGATLHQPHSFTGKTAAQYSVIGLTVRSNSTGSAAIYVLSGDGA